MSVIRNRLNASRRAYVDAIGSAKDFVGSHPYESSIYTLRQSAARNADLAYEAKEADAGDIWNAVYNSIDASITEFEGEVGTGTLAEHQEFQCLICAWENPYSPRNEEGICTYCQERSKFHRNEIAIRVAHKKGMQTA